MAKINVRKGMPSVKLDKPEFKKRFLSRFYDPDYDPLMPELDKLVDAAWVTYDQYRKSPRTQKAGKEFADPNFDLPVEWFETRAKVRAAERKQKNRKTPSRILIVNGSPRNDQTCPRRNVEDMADGNASEGSDRKIRAASRSRFSICHASRPNTAR